MITTCNRARRASKTIQQFLDLEPVLAGQIIVVDSSDAYGRDDYPQHEKVIYLRSSHKNQPYQRLIGYLASAAEILVFVDDDMDLIDESGFFGALELFSDEKIVGLNFDFMNDNAFLSATPRNLVKNWNSGIRRALQWFSGSPKIEENRLWFCGLRGKRTPGAPIEYVSGGAFAARRRDLFVNFNYQLLDLFEHQLGMGEDLIIGYTLSKRGKIWSVHGLTFYHDDQKDSSYTPDLYSFYRRVAFSRLFISCEIARLSRHSSWWSILHYHWFSFWRLTSMLLTLIAQPSQARFEMAKGWASGWFRNLRLRTTKIRQRKQYWLQEANNDLS